MRRFITGVLLGIVLSVGTAYAYDSDMIIAILQDLDSLRAGFSGLTKSHNDLCDDYNSLVQKHNQLNHIVYELENRIDRIERRLP